MSRATFSVSFFVRASLVALVVLAGAALWLPSAFGEELPAECPGLSNRECSDLKNQYDELQKEIADEGKELLVVLIPDIRPGTSNIENLPEYDEVRRYLHDEKIRVLDLDPYFRDYFIQHPQERIVFEHDLHWNSSGHKLVGSIIGENLKN